MHYVVSVNNGNFYGEKFEIESFPTGTMAIEYGLSLACHGTIVSIIAFDHDADCWLECQVLARQICHGQGFVYMG